MKTVLLVEDNPQNAYLMTYLLEKNGYQVVHARDGAEGLERASKMKARPCAVVLDIQLPFMDGHDVARSLRAQPSLAGIAIIAVTSYAMPGDREKAFAAGCNGYMQKPVNPDTFVAELEHLAGLSGGPPPSTTT